MPGALAGLSFSPSYSELSRKLFCTHFVVVPVPPTRALSDAFALSCLVFRYRRVQELGRRKRMFPCLDNPLRLNAAVYGPNSSCPGPSLRWSRGGRKNRLPALCRFVALSLLRNGIEWNEVFYTAVLTIKAKQSPGHAPLFICCVWGPAPVAGTLLYL